MGPNCLSRRGCKLQPPSGGHQPHDNGIKKAAMLREGSLPRHSILALSIECRPVQWPPTWRGYRGHTVHLERVRERLVMRHGWRLQALTGGKSASARRRSGARGRGARIKASAPRPHCRGSTSFEQSSVPSARRKMPRPLRISSPLASARRSTAVCTRWWGRCWSFGRDLTRMPIRALPKSPDVCWFR
jgi:hypothetical protein